MKASDYLHSRGIDSDVAHVAGVRFCPNWYGPPAVVFALYDADGRRVAVQGRYIDCRGDPKTRSAGSIGRGIFATPGAWTYPVRVLTEAPLDAISLAVCGVPALALCGKDIRAWLLPRLALQPTLLALDADDAGDTAATEWTRGLTRFASQTTRMRPVGGKDWNELLIRLGTTGLTSLLQASTPQAFPGNRETETFFEKVCRLFGPVQEIIIDEASA